MSILFNIENLNCIAKLCYVFEISSIMEWRNRMLYTAVIIGGMCIYLPKLGVFSDYFIALFPEIIQFPILYLHNRMPNVTGDTSRSWTLFTEEELQKYTNEDAGLYLALLGKVYDVSKGSKYYGADGGYNFFTGCDASRAFVTGDFSKAGLSDDVTGLSTEELISLDKWVQFYKKEYTFKGKLIGRYYDKTGKATSYNKKVKRLIREAKNNKEEEAQQKLLHPPCNAEWSHDTGSRVWCTILSGGIERDWVGVPRQLYDPGSHEYHCACIRQDQLHAYKGKIKEYPNCNPDASSCKVNS